jgi:hypothetical protein
MSTVTAPQLSPKHNAGSVVPVAAPARNTSDAADEKKNNLDTLSSAAVAPKSPTEEQLDRQETWKRYTNLSGKDRREWDAALGKFMGTEGRGEIEKNLTTWNVMEKRFSDMLELLSKSPTTEEICLFLKENPIVKQTPSAEDSYNAEKLKDLKTFVKAGILSISCFKNYFSITAFSLFLIRMRPSLIGVDALFSNLPLAEKNLLRELYKDFVELDVVSEEEIVDFLYGVSEINEDSHGWLTKILESQKLALSNYEQFMKELNASMSMPMIG